MPLTARTTVRHPSRPSDKGGANCRASQRGRYSHGGCLRAAKGTGAKRMLPRCFKRGGNGSVSETGAGRLADKRAPVLGTVPCGGDFRPGARQKARGRTQAVGAKSGWNRIPGKQPVRMAASCGGGVQGSWFVPRAAGIGAEPGRCGVSPLEWVAAHEVAARERPLPPIGSENGKNAKMQTSTAEIKPAARAVETSLKTFQRWFKQPKGEGSPSNTHVPIPRFLNSKTLAMILGEAVRLGHALRIHWRVSSSSATNHHDSDSFSTTSLLASTREHSSQRFLSGSIVSL